MRWIWQVGPTATVWARAGDATRTTRRGARESGPAACRNYKRAVRLATDTRQALWGRRRSAITKCGAVVFSVVTERPDGRAFTDFYRCLFWPPACLYRGEHRVIGRTDQCTRQPEIAKILT